MQQDNRYQQARNVTIIGALVNLFLAIIKVIFGWLGQSQALIADGVHSFSDLLTDALVLIASHFGSRKADWDHPYGHQRIETAATLFLALLLILAGVGIAWDSLEHIFHGTVDHPKFYVLIVAFISVIANEGLYHYTLHIGKKITSNLLIANAWHHRSDAASSIVVLIGVAGAMLGYVYLDSVAAIIVGLLIIKMGWNLGWTSVRELVDTGVPYDTLEEIRVTILSIPGILEIHQLRTRCMADNILVDVHILVDPKLSVSEGHFIATQVHYQLMKTINKITDVTVHVDPENDEIAPPSVDLPPRQEAVAQLKAHCLNCPGLDYIDNIKLHYLAGKIEVELTMPLMVLEEGQSAQQLRQQYSEAAKSLSYIKSITIEFF